MKISIKVFFTVFATISLFAILGCASSVPSEPIRVKATDSTEGVNVSWSPPAGESGGKVETYVVTANPGRISVEVPGRTLETTIKELDKDVAYTFTVQAKNESGASEVSKSTAKVIPEPVPVEQESPPIRVSAEAGNGIATVKWQPPENVEEVTAYTVISKPETRPVRVSPPDSKAVFEDLRNGISYTFVVIPSTSNGPGEESLPSSPVTPVGVPDAPSNVKVKSGDGEATVNWTAPRSDGGATVSRYLIESTPGRASARTSGNQGSVLIKNLKNGTEYVFTVTAVNEVGPGEKSRPSRPTLVSDRANRSN